MKKLQSYSEYLAPEFEELSIVVERGFDGSSQLPEYEEDDDIIELG